MGSPPDRRAKRKGACANAHGRDRATDASLSNTAGQTAEIPQSGKPTWGRGGRHTISPVEKRDAGEPAMYAGPLRAKRDVLREAARMQERTAQAKGDRQRQKARGKTNGGPGPGATQQGTEQRDQGREDTRATPKRPRTPARENNKSLGRARVLCKKGEELENTCFHSEQSSTAGEADRIDGNGRRRA